MAKKTTEKKEPCFICTRNTLIHVRPAIGSGVVDVCQAGEKLSPISISDEWIQIEAGYVSMANVEPSDKKDNG